ncbi:daunorubicin resistance protein DrrA family ABC transporter ATP-binding protein [Oceanobacillus oncorhynchi subsp. incaldanensis]|uniref:SkfA peptide export ATP-binding protein SkfE n=2 Tax=Oceanobacillus TaxID=182709 RepID=A0A0A1MM07_9BACI|nr:ABC transporter ATP-binding protein [Oceanobacillus oncorhynchi]MDM8099439.1 ABC transporter ATP-binding protein [Oceanobacillus oncorhynchi]UUI38437.1 ABC transporter ATP-binding protein [Oceanobacillus oncorhynchi]GIO20962.1 daunorubicin resistance protein DrrA family ABC transporter ATP-binding protein [Oceanobacillus oncorhynchi subsp. incaldanensis]CEI84118.1 SkfA peptide export ATP-binding protein SkfE [Oceanobacillus oncorhynchi]
MEKIIEISQLNKSYRKRKSKEIVQAVKDVDFNVYKGEILGLLGPNGAGKTTTIKLICGLLYPDSGEIKIKGVPNTAKRLESLHHISAVLEGNRNLYWRLTVRENLEYFAGNRGRSRKEVKEEIDELLQIFRLKEKENELVNRLSRGMQQKLAIAVAMLANTEVMLLDEPTLGLDVQTGLEVREILKSIVQNYQRTVIISSHDMEVIQDICDRTVIINQGTVVIDQRVDELIKLFEVRSYRLTLNEALSPDQQKAISARFPANDYVEDELFSYLTVQLEKSEDIYQIFQVLQLNRTPIDSIDRKSIRFDEVFLKIIEGDFQHAVD